MISGLFEPIQVPPRVRREARLEAFAMLRRSAPIAVLTTVGCVAVVLGVIAASCPPWEIMLWAVLLGAPPMMRLHRWWRGRHRGRPVGIKERTVSRSIAIAMLAGAAWGAFGAIHLISRGVFDQALIGCAIAGMAAAATLELYRLPSAGVGFVLTSTLPCVGALLALGGRFELFAAALTLFYVLFLMVLIRAGYASFLGVVRLKLENDDLLRQTQAASDAKTSFLATMSHELRTPLNAVIGYAQLMQQQIHGPLGHSSYNEYADHIETSGEILLELINDILDVSKIEAGKYQIDEEMFALREVIVGACRLIEPRAASKMVALVADDIEDTTELFADQRAIKQVLVNILTNAIKFTDEGGTITISEGWRRNGDYRVRIEDTGIGMTREELARAFKMFERGSASGRNVEGTGIGLPLSRSLVELHGGTLEIDSMPDIGTTVTITLPASRAFQRSADQPKQTPNAA